MVAIEEFSNALVRLTANIIEIIVHIIRSIMSNLSVDFMIKFMDFLVRSLDVLVEAIVPTIDPITRIVLAIINITESDPSANEAFHNFTSTASENLSVIIGPANASSGFTYILESVMTEADPVVAGYFLQVLWDC